MKDAKRIERELVYLNDMIEAYARDYKKAIAEGDEEMIEICLRKVKTYEVKRSTLEWVLR